jgi:hypothetical protein
MKAYKVLIGYEKDHYGYSTNNEIAKYFFNKEDAIKCRNEGTTYEYNGEIYYNRVMTEIEIN